MLNNRTDISPWSGDGIRLAPKRGDEEGAVKINFLPFFDGFFPAWGAGAKRLRGYARLSMICLRTWFFWPRGGRKCVVWKCLVHRGNADLVDKATYCYMASWRVRKKHKSEVEAGVWYEGTSRGFRAFCLSLRHLCFDMLRNQYSDEWSRTWKSLGIKSMAGCALVLASRACLLMLCSLGLFSSWLFETWKDIACEKRCTCKYQILPLDWTAIKLEILLQATILMLPSLLLNKTLSSELFCNEKFYHLPFSRIWRFRTTLSIYYAGVSWWFYD